MWPFRKKEQKSLEEIQLGEHKWSVKRGNGKDGPIIVRINESAKEWAKHPQLNIRVGFAIPLRIQNPEGLPDSKENEEMNLIEDEICNLLCATGPAIQVLAITTGKFKEYVFYIKNGAEIENAHKQAMSRFPGYDVQCYGQTDTNWDEYFRWQKA